MNHLKQSLHNVNQTDLVVASVSALVCLGTMVGMPVWALFIGWAWYLTIGANKRAIKEGSITCISAAVLALTAVCLTDSLSANISAIYASMISVFLTILALMILLKLPWIKHALVAFNSFSCIFAGYYLGAFPIQQEYLINIALAFIYITGSNLLGLWVGWASQQLSCISFTHKSKYPSKCETIN